MLILVSVSHAERIEMECGFIEPTDRGLQCEFNNIFMFNTTEVIIIELNSSIDAVSFRQSDLHAVPSDIFRKFPRLKHLDVELTQMKVIESDNFLGAVELKYFLSRFNEIEELNFAVFLNCPNLKFIVLQYNLISWIDPAAFDGLNHLEALYLDFNRVKRLTPRVLDWVPNLLHFSMAYNNLSFTPEQLFMRNVKLETLNLGHNLLTSFNDKQFEKLPNLERVQLDHNKLRALDLRTCKSTEISVDKNLLEVLELNKWTRFISAWGNPIKKFTLHEHYGTGRGYNFSFTQVDEITFFVNENCCTVENLENFFILTQSFGDLSHKKLDVNDWKCKFLKTSDYQTPSGRIVNNVCTKQKQVEGIFTATDSIVSSEEEISTESRLVEATEPTLLMAQRGNIHNQEDFIESDELTIKPRESMEDDTSGLFVGMNIETLEESDTTPVSDFHTAFVQEIFPTTTDKAYEEKCEKGIYKTVKKKVIGWKDKAVKKWNDWVG